jgi:hypothetical protein
MSAVLSPEDINDLVVKAFTLEALTDKPGCTTRYQDLPGKPLQDFIIAGINSSRFFASLARNLEKDPESPIFRYNLDALKASNKHKSTKYINFGLLEIMFPVVYARLKTNERHGIVSEIVEAIKATTNEDVRSLLDTRALAWSTSNTVHKIGFDVDKYKKLGTVWEFYMALNEDFDEETLTFSGLSSIKKDYPFLKPSLMAILNQARLLRPPKPFSNDKRRRILKSPLEYWLICVPPPSFYGLATARVPFRVLYS